MVCWSSYATAVVARAVGNRQTVANGRRVHGGFENASPDGAICMAVIYTVRGVYETYWHRMAREWDAKNRPTTLLILQRDISYA